jgi:hypothetical protein
MTATSPSTWPRRWDQPISATDHGRAVSMMREVRVRRTKMLAAITNAESPRRAKRLSRRYMRSPSARLACLAMAAERKFKSVKKANEMAVALVECLGLVDVWTPAVARAKAIPKEKFGGGLRWIFTFHVLDHARQRLVMDVATALTRHEPTQFMSAGGRNGFEEWLGEEIAQAQVVITTDIPSCFNRVLRDAVADGLPLSGRVMEEVLFRPMDNALYLKRTPGGLTPMLKEEVAQVSSPKRGIPQGSAASSVASERVIGRIIRRVEAASPDARIATYGDNLIILLRDPGIEQSVRDALASEAEACFGSDVISELTRRTRTGLATAWFSFAGRDYRRQGKTLKIKLGSDRIAKFVGKTIIDIDDAKRAKDRKRLLRLDRSVQAWIRQTVQFPGALDNGLTLAAVIRRSRLYLETPVEPPPQDEPPPLAEAS